MATANAIVLLWETLTMCEGCGSFLLLVTLAGAAVPAILFSSLVIYDRSTVWDALPASLRAPWWLREVLACTPAGLPPLDVAPEDGASLRSHGSDTLQLHHLFILLLVLLSCISGLGVAVFPSAHQHTHPLTASWISQAAPTTPVVAPLPVKVALEISDLDRPVSSPSPVVRKKPKPHLLIPTEAQENANDAAVGSAVSASISESPDPIPPVTSVSPSSPQSNSVPLLSALPSAEPSTPALVLPSVAVLPVHGPGYRVASGDPFGILSSPRQANMDAEDATLANEKIVTYSTRSRLLHHPKAKGPPNLVFITLSGVGSHHVTHADGTVQADVMPTLAELQSRYGSLTFPSMYASSPDITRSHVRELVNCDDFCF